MKYAVIGTSSIYHEGDERSRTNPGHGYPAYTETVTTYREFKSEEDMIEHYRTQDRYSKNRYVRVEDIQFIEDISIKVK